MGRLLLADNSNGDNYTSVKDCGKFLKTIYQMDKGHAQKILLQVRNTCTTS